MAHILIATSGFPSTLYPSLELGRRLAAAGHRVTFIGDDEGRRAKLAKHLGLEFLPLAPSGYRRFLDEDSRRSRITRWRQLPARRRAAVKSLAVEGFVKDLRRAAPDLVLIDGEMHEHIISAAADGWSVALLNSFPATWRRPGLPPLHISARPGVGWRGSRLGLGLAWTAYRGRKKLRALSHRWRWAGCDRISVLEALAQEVGFDFRQEIDDSQWLIPFTYRHLPVLSLHAREFDFPHRPPKRVRYVGPMVLRQRMDRNPRKRDRKRLEELFRRRRSDPQQRLIYAGFGSMLTADLGFLRRLVSALSSESSTESSESPPWELILSLSGQVKPSDLGELPPTVHAFSWVPQLEVLEHADAAITHGGVNTLDECILAGVPMLVYCGGETDMAGNTARVVHHGLGLAGDRDRDDGEAIRGRIFRLLAGGERRLEAMRQHYRAYQTESVAERTVEMLLRRFGAGEKRVRGESSP
ncbi:MAG: glycosyltransferase [Acidobacteriota bacterium]